MAKGSDIMYLEPFYGGSHKQLIDLLQREFGGTLYSLPPAKWHWRARVSALQLVQQIPHDFNYKLACSYIASR